MRLLLDECVDEHLRHLFPGLDCQTARFAGLAGVENGRLLDAAEAAGFDILIAVKQNIPDKQNLVGRKDFNRNSLRANKPLARFGTPGTASDFRALDDRRM